MSGRRERDPLEIVEERVLLGIPRGDEELRLTHTRARGAQGKDIAWHSLRIFWRNDAGDWKPGKQGITIRSAELKAVAEALVKAAAGSMRREQPAPSTPTDDDADLDRIFGEAPR